MTEDELTNLMEEVRPVTFVSIDGTHEQSELEDQSMHETIPDDSCIPALDALDRKEILSLLTLRMAELPDMSKKVLAMYCYREHAPLRNCGLLPSKRVSDLPNPHPNDRFAPELPRQALGLNHRPCHPRKCFPVAEKRNL